MSTTLVRPTVSQLQKTTFGALSRSQLMAKVKSFGNATTELRMARMLRALSIGGWRRHSNLPGRPDFAWPKRRVALFVNGCFWHGHDCGRNLTPRSNVGFWREKIARNQRRDRRVDRTLRARGWTVLRIWECRLDKSREIQRVSRVVLDTERISTVGQICRRTGR